MNAQSIQSTARHALGALAILLLTIPGTADGAEHFVPTDYPTIHEAIFAAADGDVVTVAPGEYDAHSGISFNGLPRGSDAPATRNLTLRSAEGPERTVIRMAGQGPVAFFAHGEGPESRLQGFTLVGGRGWNAVETRNTADVIPDEYHGGGVFIYGSSPVIEDCIIRGNGVLDSVTYGGGVACTGRGAEPRFLRCRIIENTAGYGGGVFCSEASPVFVDCTISGNLAREGGGLFCADWPFGSAFGNPASPYSGWPPLPADTAPGRFLRCHVVDNAAEVLVYPGGWWGGSGGGMTLWTSADPEPSPRWEFTACLISNNSAGALGSGIYCEVPIDFDQSTETLDDGGRVAVFDRCLIRDNRSTPVRDDPRGAVYVYRSEMRHCAVTGNEGAGETVGLLISRLTNCTVARNPAGGVHDFGTENPSEMRNSIVWGNGAPTTFPAFLVDGVSNLTYNCIEDEAVAEGQGNINVDPRLDRDGRLLPGSPCIDAGDNLAVPTDPFDADADDDRAEPSPLDAAGGWRFWDETDAIDTGRGSGPIVDMGAFEYRLFETTGIRRGQDESFEIDFAADPPAPGHAYRLLRSPDLGESWTAIDGLEPIDAGGRRHRFVVPASGDLPAAFFRVAEQPVEATP